ncbi:hypothetical protein [Halapricum salinum]|uniref:hypothetical protein n=1 Tax=Halapricum salinum TaxID=1457250 RepID=UPI001F24AC52|nr:hypothetical protein [Halapricum salinum]
MNIEAMAEATTMLLVLDATDDTTVVVPNDSLISHLPPVNVVIGISIDSVIFSPTR